MNGTQRLSVIHSLLNPHKPFLFDYQKGISAKRVTDYQGLHRSDAD